MAASMATAITGISCSAADPQIPGQRGRLKATIELKEMLDRLESDGRGARHA